ncbi:DUF6993 domain-containing protein [Marisediminicola antarctica]|uniref:DUF6993 domain-containing protein n=1 Tax=Marisediminicola antarctica TaxID=674079 RepID=A0A7L5AMJ5_9MICO|nr:hypothetical protein [Marisediminicola antarctica]QHO70554.1 hypothetical protein BHD05_13740 [Marisediminicola antarctica]
MAPATLGIAIAIALTVTGCGVSDPELRPSTAAVDPSGESESESESEPAPGTEPEPEPSAQFDPDGTASDNLAFFDDVNARFLAADPSPGGRPIVDNLVAAGFDREAMELTRDTTPIGLQADSVQFSVRIGDACLVGQASDSGYVGIVGPLFADSRCLIGELRPIDW